jgi:hypothetical protein
MYTTVWWLLIRIYTLSHYCCKGPSWSYDSWIYNYLCNQCLSPPTLWVRIPIRRGVLDTALCNKVCQWLATGRWFSPLDRHDITEILLKVALNTINQTKTIIIAVTQQSWMAHVSMLCNKYSKVWYCNHKISFCQCWVRVMVFNATFNNISVISWVHFHWWGKREYPEKTTDLPQVT